MAKEAASTTSAPPIEYRVREFKVKQSAEELEAILNAELGPEGWTLVAVLWAGDDRYNAFFTRAGATPPP